MFYLQDGQLVHQRVRSVCDPWRGLRVCAGARYAVRRQRHPRDIPTIANKVALTRTAPPNVVTLDILHHL